MKADGYVLDTNICAFYLRGRFNVDMLTRGQSPCETDNDIIFYSIQ